LNGTRNDYLHLELIRLRREAYVLVQQHYLLPFDMDRSWNSMTSSEEARGVQVKENHKSVPPNLSLVFPDSSLLVAAAKIRQQECWEEKENQKKRFQLSASENMLKKRILLKKRGVKNDYSFDGKESVKWGGLELCDENKCFDDECMWITPETGDENRSLLKINTDGTLNDSLPIKQNRSSSSKTVLENLPFTNISPSTNQGKEILEPQKVNGGGKWNNIDLSSDHHLANASANGHTVFNMHTISPSTSPNVLINFPPPSVVRDVNSPISPLFVNLSIRTPNSFPNGLHEISTMFLDTYFKARPGNLIQKGCLFDLFVLKQGASLKVTTYIPFNTRKEKQKISNVRRPSGGASVNLSRLINSTRLFCGVFADMLLLYHPKIELFDSFSDESEMEVSPPFICMVDCAPQHEVLPSLCLYLNSEKNDENGCEIKGDNREQETVVESGSCAVYGCDGNFCSPVKKKEQLNDSGTKNKPFSIISSPHSSHPTSSYPPPSTPYSQYVASSPLKYSTLKNCDLFKSTQDMVVLGVSSPPQLQEKQKESTVGLPLLFPFHPHFIHPLVVHGKKKYTSSITPPSPFVWILLTRSKTVIMNSGLFFKARMQKSRPVQMKLPSSEIHVLPKVNKIKSKTNSQLPLPNLQSSPKSHSTFLYSFFGYDIF
jgi:hypothetical protein